MKNLLLLLPLLGIACNDALSPCASWQCRSAALAIHTELLPDSFPHQKTADGKPLWAPGDRLLLRLSIHNYADTATDSLGIVLSGAGWVGAEATTRILAPLAPGESRVILDTLMVSQFTFTNTARIEFSAFHWVTAPGATEPRLYVTGVDSFPVLATGYELEPVLFTGAKLVQRNGETVEAVELRVHTPAGVLVRLRNPYKLAAPPIPVHVCVFDYDYCPSMDTVLAPAVQPGEEVYAELPYELNFGERWDWWNQADVSLGLCPEKLFYHCTWKRLRLLPNIEADCDVVAVTPDVSMTDATPECPKLSYNSHGRSTSWSAYRFQAAAGERYRVEVLNSANWVPGGFIVPADGIPEPNPLSSEVGINTSGTYYVILEHNSTVTFRLLKLL